MRHMVSDAVSSAIGGGLASLPALPVSHRGNETRAKIEIFDAEDSQRPHNQACQNAGCTVEVSITRKLQIMLSNKIRSTPVTFWFTCALFEI